VRAEVVVIMGCPGAGKSTLAEPFVADGWQRLNRDLAGGRLDGIAAALDRGLAAGGRRFVLDNTYASRASRAPVLTAAARHGAACRCIWLDTPLSEAQVNACERMLARHGRLLEPGELGRRDPNAFPPRAQHRFRRELEPPAEAEGFAAVEVRRFARRADPARHRAGALVELGDLAPGARWDVLAAARARGAAVAATAWLPGVEDAEAAARLAALRAALGFDVEVAWCRHPGGPLRCWCRKPMPGLGVVLAARLGLDPARSVCVGAGWADREFARRIGMGFQAG
jgi:adenylate kinase family enzyme